MRLIDADALRNKKKQAIITGHERYGCEVVEFIEIVNAPTIDAVPVVRCGECKRCDPENMHCDHPMGTALPIGRKPNDFCSYGERREDDAATVVHARWEINLDGYYPYCSNCKAEPKSGKMTPACPNCGAKMDLEADDNG